MARSGTSTLEGVARARDDLDGEQRVAAEVDEALVDADALALEHVGPDRREHLLDRACAARRRRRLLRRGAERRRARARSTLPFGVSGSASSTTNARRHHVARAAAAARNARELGGRRRAPLGGTTKATRRWPPGASSSRQDDRLAHRRVRAEHGLDLAELDAEAADLHLVVDAAEEDRACRPGSQRARSPVR